MKFFFLLSIIFSLLISCKKYNLKIDTKHRQLLKRYSVNDTLYYKDKLGDIDTVRISEIDSIEQGLVLGTVPPMKEIYIRIEHLPKNNWKDVEIAGTNEEVRNQPLITIANYRESCCQIRINYRDFENEDSPTMEMIKNKIDTLHSYPGSRFKPTPNKVTEIYWSNISGIIGYKKKNGKIYHLKKQNQHTTTH